MKDLKVIVFNVRQGDHILLEFPDGRLGIIDCKVIRIGAGQNQEEIVPCMAYIEYLMASGTKPIVSFLILSHNDSDHIGGVNSLMQFLIKKRIPVEKIHYSGHIECIMTGAIKSMRLKIDHDELIEAYLKDIQDYVDGVNQFSRTNIDKMRRIVDSNRFNRGELRAKETLHMPGLNIMCLSPKGDHVASFDEDVSERILEALLPLIFRRELLDQEERCLQNELSEFEIGLDRFRYQVDRNQISIVMRIRYGDHSLIFTGDTPPKILKESIDWLGHNGCTAEDSKGNFVKASHHGSRHSSNAGIWKVISDASRTLYVSVSAGIQYKHPHKELLSHIENAVGSNYCIHRTNLCEGCISKQAPKEAPDFGWFDRGVEKYLADDAGAVVSNPIFAEKNPKGKEGLAAWIYHFKPDSPEPEVSIETSRYIDVYRVCPTEAGNCPHRKG